MYINGCQRTKGRERAEEEGVCVCEGGREGWLTSGNQRRERREKRHCRSGQHQKCTQQPAVETPTHHQGGDDNGEKNGRLGAGWHRKKVLE